VFLIFVEQARHRCPRFFAEITEQEFAPAGGDFCVVNHLLQLCAGDVAFLFVRLFVNEAHLLYTIAGAEH